VRDVGNAKEPLRWEHGLNEDVVGWLWDFCKAKRNHLLVRAEELHPLACDIVRQGFAPDDSAELFVQGHIFSRHFSGLQTLVAAADQVESRDLGSTSGVSQHQLARDTQAQQQRGARNEGLIAGQVLGSMPYCLPDLSSETDPDVLAQFDVPSATPTATVAIARSSGQLDQQTTNASFSALDPYTGAARHHHLQDGLGLQSSAPDIGPAAAAVGSQQCDSQTRAILTLATGNHQMYERDPTSQWTQEATPTNAANYGRKLQDGHGLQPVCWPRSASRGPYPTTPQSTALLHNTDPNWTQHLAGSEIPLTSTFNPPQDRLGQVDMAMGRCGGGFWADAWLDDLAQAGGFHT
jgi:hypothetical protein